MPDLSPPDVDLAPVDHDPFTPDAPPPDATPPAVPTAPKMVSDEDLATQQVNEQAQQYHDQPGVIGSIKQLYDTATTPEGRSKIGQHIANAVDMLNPAVALGKIVTPEGRSELYNEYVSPLESQIEGIGQATTGKLGPEQEADFGANMAMQMVFGGVGGGHAEEDAAGVAGGKLKQPDVPPAEPQPLPKTASPEDHPDRIDQRIPTAKTPVEAEGGGPRTVDLDAMKLTPDLYEHNVNLVRDYPGVNIPKNYGTDKTADAFINQAAGNLVFLHDQVPENIRQRSALWYDGGNKIANDFADKYGVTDSQSAGAIAAMSPQKDWYNNVSLADRVLNTIKGGGDNFYNGFTLSPEMEKSYNETPSLMKYPQFFDQIKGKTLSDIDQMVPFPKDERSILKSMWIRLYDQAHVDPSVYKVSPEGNFMPEVSQNVAWGSLPEISKAVSIIEGDGNVSDLVGKRNKVRNFYNNILTPNSPVGDVTIDTHAVAASLLRPFSANSTEVGHNFGNSLPKEVPIENAKNSAKTGVWGTYPLYAEAYRRAANQLGILPRQLQSITWEAVRGLFPEDWKNPKNSAIIDNIWRQSKKVGIDETRQRILNAAGGIKPPTWLVDERNQQIRDAGRARLRAGAPDASAQGAGNTAELPGRGVYGTGTEGAVTGAGSGTPGSLAEKVNEPAATTTANSTEGVDGGRGVGPAPGTAEDAVAAAQVSAQRAAAGRQKLIGLPDQPVKSAGHFVPGPVGYLHDIAEQYMHDEGFDYAPPKTYQPVDPERATRIAKAFDEMKHDPSDPRVGASYDAMIQETLAQYSALKQAGVKFDFIKPGMEDPYKANPRLAAKDVVDNKHLWVYPTDTGFGTDAAAREAIKDNPLLAPTDEYIDGKRLLANDVFRIVHDMFGHFKDGNGFRAGGEENAWRSHSAMYSDLARPAMTSETRGQNSWLNYGPHGEKNRTASAADTIYADQKVGRLPDWVMEEGRRDPADLQPVEYDPFSARKDFTLGSGSTDKRTAPLSLPIWWHGSASGDLRGGKSGLHLGTKLAATQALEARIGTPASGLGWRGDSEYGKTLLAGTDTLDKMGPYNRSGIRAGGPNMEYPKEDHYAPDYFAKYPEAQPTYPDGTKMPLDVKPSVEPYYITGQMTNKTYAPHEDFKANGYMQAALKRGTAKNGYYYKNAAEDSGSISAVVPNGDHVKAAPGHSIYNDEKQYPIAPRTDYSPSMTLGSGQTSDEAAPRFFSAVEQAVNSAKTNSAPPSQWLGMIKNTPGVKPEEMEWLGLEDWLKGQKGNVTKQQVADYVRGNKVDVQEVEHGAMPSEEEREAAEERYQKAHRAILDADINSKKWNALNREFRDAQYELQRTEKPSETRYGPNSGYGLTLPGGKNYRELLLTLPENKEIQALRDEADRRGYGSSIKTWPDQDFANRYRAAITNNPNLHYKSSHWDEQNVLAHIRFDDRTVNPTSDEQIRDIGQRMAKAVGSTPPSMGSGAADAAVKKGAVTPQEAAEFSRAARWQNQYADQPGLSDKTLHMAEVQSDWHQKGRKQGYQSNKFALKEPSGETYEVYPTRAAAEQEQRTEGGAGHALTLHEISGTGVPDAPFKTTWPELALKRMIRYAAENGYDRLSWDTGATNADRYDLGHKLDRIEHVKEGDKYRVRAYSKDDPDAVLSDGNLPQVFSSPEEIEKYYGKDIAKKVVNGEGNDPERSTRFNQGVKVLSGEGLRVGEGMTGFYDKMLPAAANKIVKKYGTNVEASSLPSEHKVMKAGPLDWRIVDPEGNGLKDNHGDPWSFGSRENAEDAAKKLTASGTKIHSIKITPELRRSAMQQGFPMFASGGAVDQYADFRRSQNVIDDRNESVAEKLYNNLTHNVGAISNWVTGNKPPPAPAVPATTTDPMASALGYNDIPGRARGGRALPEKYGANHIDYAFDINRWGMYDKHGYLIKSGSIKDVPKRAHGGRVEPDNIDPNPSEAQKDAGNYAKDHIHIHGLPITIENPKGGKRNGVGRDGKPWECVMPAHYGYFKRTEGADGDHVDCYVGPHPMSSHVFVIDQVDDKTKAFDETKVMLGFGTEAQATTYYKKGFSDGRGKDRIGRVTALPMSVFKLWLKHGNTKKPFNPAVKENEATQ